MMYDYYIRATLELANGTSIVRMRSGLGHVRARLTCFAGAAGTTTPIFCSLVTASRSCRHHDIAFCEDWPYIAWTIT